MITEDLDQEAGITIKKDINNLDQEVVIDQEDKEDDYKYKVNNNTRFNENFI